MESFVNTLAPLAFEGTFGLERETLRVDADGYLSQTPHPFPQHKHIDRDFCESQVEIITPVCHSIEGLWQAIAEIDAETRAGLLSLPEPEYLWPFSNPPYILGEDGIPVAQFVGEQAQKTEYRRYLAEKYGKRLMLFCGIHYNYAYSDAFVQQAQQVLGLPSPAETRNYLYLQLSKKIELTSWLVVFLTAASPVFDGSFFEDGQQGLDGFTGEASMRSGEDGYWNDFVPIIDYSSAEAYTASIQQYVDSGRLKQPSEWYTPVRIKPRGENALSALRENGADHIELRMLDVNPLEKLGICKSDLEFLRLYLIYLTFSAEEPFGEAQQIAAVQDHKASALYDAARVTVHLHGAELPMVQAASQFLQEMESFFREIGHPEALPILQEMQGRCADPQKRHAVRVYEQFCERYVEKGLALAKAYSAGQQHIQGKRED